MKASAILTSALGHRQARKIKRELNKAMVASSAITAHTVRHVDRLAWEGKRSPSRLGRMGERADQLNALATPLAAGATAIITVASAALQLYIQYTDWKRCPLTTLSGEGEHGDA